MAKDYAKLTDKKHHARKQLRKRRKLYLALLLMFSVIAGWFFSQDSLHFTKEQTFAWFKTIKTFIHPPSPAISHSIVKTVAANTVIQEPEVHFDFYTELPNRQVTLPVSSNQVPSQSPSFADASIAQKKNASKSIIQEDLKLTKDNNEKMVIKNFFPRVPANDIKKSKITNESLASGYVVQIGAYKNDSTASEIRVSILLAGFDAKVIKTLLGDQIIYRIQQGPYVSLSLAKNAQKKLHTKGFEGVIQKLKET